MVMENGVKAFYEGAKSNAKTLNGWANEYFRAECERCTVVLAHRRIEFLVEGDEPLEVPLLEQSKWANVWLIEKFVNVTEDDHDDLGQIVGVSSVADGRRAARASRNRQGPAGCQRQGECRRQ